MTERPEEPRTYVLDDEFGVMCLIPLEMYQEEAQDAEEAYWLIEKRNFTLSEVDYFSEKEDACGTLVRQLVEEMLTGELLHNDGTWNLPAVWQHLVDHGVLEDDDEEMPEDWTPSSDELGQIRIYVPDSFYESSGLRAEKWAGELPDSIVLEFGQASEGFFGDYFGFDWSDEDEIIAALTSLGHRVIHARNLGKEPDQ